MCVVDKREGRVVCVPVQVTREMFFHALSQHRQRTDKKKKNKKNNVDVV
jgi:hypothetical protein